MIFTAAMFLSGVSMVLTVASGLCDDMGLESTARGLMRAAWAAFTTAFVVCGIGLFLKPAA